MGIAISVGGIYLSAPTETYEKQVIEKIVEPEWATNQEAVGAAKAVIRRQKLEAELVTLNNDWVTTSAEYEAEKASYLEKKEKLEKELGTY